MRLRGLLKALRRGRIKDLKAQDNWRKRGSATFVKARGILLHHTASSRQGGDLASLGTVVNGRPDLPGPLCHILIGRSGQVRIIASGRANHAGYGGPFGWVPENLGNSFLIGIEIENNGVGEPYSEEQMDAVLEVCVALLKRYRGRLVRRKPRKAASKVKGHKEWTYRKIDPSFSMDRFRDELTERLRKG